MGDGFEAPTSLYIHEHRLGRYRGIWKWIDARHPAVSTSDRYGVMEQSERFAFPLVMIPTVTPMDRSHSKHCKTSS